MLLIMIQSTKKIVYLLSLERLWPALLFSSRQNFSTLLTFINFVHKFDFLWRVHQFVGLWNKFIDGNWKPVKKIGRHTEADENWINSIHRSNAKSCFCKNFVNTNKYFCYLQFKRCSWKSIETWKNLSTFSSLGAMYSKIPQSLNVDSFFWLN